jgi:Fuc2NAc and GlcNAc transferase
VLRSERVYEAHRSHAYQWLARGWNSHLRVTVGCIGLNVLWLAPWAWICLRIPEYAAWWVLGAWFPLIVIAFAAGAGRRESC